MTPFKFTPVEEDDCSGCEGWDDLDAEGYCKSCAEEIATDPWAVIDKWTGSVLAQGLCRDEAQHHVRVLSTSYVGERVTVWPDAVKESSLPVPGIV